MAVKQKFVDRGEMAITDASYNASGRFVTLLIILKYLIRNVLFSSLVIIIYESYVYWTVHHRDN